MSQWADPTYVDGLLDVAAPCGIPVFSSPIKATTAEYVFTQAWCCSRKGFAALPLNTPHPSAGQFPDYSSFRLVAEGTRSDIGGAWSSGSAPTQSRRTRTTNLNP